MPEGPPQPPPPETRPDPFAPDPEGDKKFDEHWAGLLVGHAVDQASRHGRIAEGVQPVADVAAARRNEPAVRWFKGGVEVDPYSGRPIHPGAEAGGAGTAVPTGAGVATGNVREILDNHNYTGRRRANGRPEGSEAVELRSGRTQRAVDEAEVESQLLQAYAGGGAGETAGEARGVRRNRPARLLDGGRPFVSPDVNDPFAIESEGTAEVSDSHGVHTLPAERHPGRNEDVALDFAPARPDQFVHGVFDGVSIPRGGEVAARLAMETVRERLAGVDEEPSEHRMAEALVAANRAVLGRLPANEQGERPGTTGSLFWVGKEEHGERTAVVGNVGDSRTYVLRANGELECVTLDDSLYSAALPESEARRVQRRLDSVVTDDDLAGLTARERAWAQNPMLVGALGTSEEARPRAGRVTLRPGDRMFSISDGVSDNLSFEEIREIARAAADAGSLAKQLVLEARQRTHTHGTNRWRRKDDDITAVAYQMGGALRPPAPAPEPGPMPGARRPVAEARAAHGPASGRAASEGAAAPPLEPARRAELDPAAAKEQERQRRHQEMRQQYQERVMTVDTPPWPAKPGTPENKSVMERLAQAREDPLFDVTLAALFQETRWRRNDTSATPRLRSHHDMSELWMSGYLAHNLPSPADARYMLQLREWRDGAVTEARAQEFLDRAEAGQMGGVDPERLRLMRAEAEASLHAGNRLLAQDEVLQTVYGARFDALRELEAEHRAAARAHEEAAVSPGGDPAAHAAYRAEQQAVAETARLDREQFAELWGELERIKMLSSPDRLNYNVRDHYSHQQRLEDLTALADVMRARGLVMEGGDEHGNLASRTNDPDELALIAGVNAELNDALKETAAGHVEPAWDPRHPEKGSENVGLLALRFDEIMRGDPRVRARELRALRAEAQKQGWLHMQRLPQEGKIHPYRLVASAPNKAKVDLELAWFMRNLQYALAEAETAEGQKLRADWPPDNKRGVLPKPFELVPTRSVRPDVDVMPGEPVIEREGRARVEVRDLETVADGLTKRLRQILAIKDFEARRARFDELRAYVTNIDQLKAGLDPVRERMMEAGQRGEDPRGVDTRFVNLPYGPKFRQFYEQYKAARAEVEAEAVRRRNERLQEVGLGPLSGARELRARPEAEFDKAFVESRGLLESIKPRMEAGEQSDRLARALEGAASGGVLVAMTDEEKRQAEAGKLPYPVIDDWRASNDARSREFVERARELKKQVDDKLEAQKKADAAAERKAKKAADEAAKAAKEKDGDGKGGQKERPFSERYAAGITRVNEALDAIDPRAPAEEQRLQVFELLEQMERDGSAVRIGEEGGVIWGFRPAGDARSLETLQKADEIVARTVSGAAAGGEQGGDDEQLGSRRLSRDELRALNVDQIDEYLSERWGAVPEDLPFTEQVNRLNEVLQDAYNAGFAVRAPSARMSYRPSRLEDRRQQAEGFFEAMEERFKVADRMRRVSRGGARGAGRGGRSRRRDGAQGGDGRGGDGGDTQGEQGPS